MTTIDKLNESITKTEDKLEQLKRQKRAKENRAKKLERALDTRRKIVIGGLVLKYFPELSQLMPQRTNAENNIEFERLAYFLSVLSADKDLVARLKTLAQAKIEASQVPPENSQQM